MNPRRWSALVGLACVAACTTGTTDSAPTPQSEAPPTPPTPTAATSPAEAETREPQTRQPLVLAVHATTRTPVRLSAGEARRVLDGRSRRWEVVAAPGTPVGDDVRVAGSARAALREVRRHPGMLAVVPADAVGPGVQTLRVGGADPVEEPGDYPLTVSGPAPPDDPVTLTVVGDIMLGRGVPSPRAALAPLADRLRSADLTVGNLESTLSDAGRAQQGSDSFYAPPSVVPLLAAAGFDALSLANNHTGDYEQRALLQTVRRLRASPVRSFGAGRDRAAAARPAVLEAGGVTFGFLGFNAIGETPRATPGAAGALSVRMPPRTGPLNRSDLGYLTRKVRDLAAGVDVVVVLPHWGTQYTHRPEPVQRRVARRLVRAGADLVAGGHPHWVQGLDLIDGTVVAHSLGNFVFDMDFMTQTMQGVVLEATYWGSELKSVDLLPYRLDTSFAPRPVRGPQGREILADVWSSSTGPFRAR